MAEEKVEKSGKGKGIVILLIIIVLLSGAAVGGMYWYMNKKVKATAEVKIEESYFDLGEYTVNLSDEGGKRYLNAKVSVGYDKANKEMATKIEEEKTVLTSITLEYLKSKKVADFDSENLENIKKGLVEALNKKVSNGQFTEAYFQKLIVQ